MMNFLAEPLIIFLVLYFPGLYSSLINLSWNINPILSFNAHQELFRIIAHNIPALCLIWYFLRKEPLRSVLGEIKLRKKDFFEAVKVAAGLIVTAAMVSLIIYFISQTEGEGIQIAGMIPWLIIAISCISTGYMEESYFRVYLLNHLSLSGIPQNKAMIASCVLFAFCHIYQGPIGLLSSLFAGLFLSFMYIKRRSIHGIALGHGLYNIISYVIASFYSVSGVSM
jgi:membrane protease YdiL (CAAX protease family)